MLDISVSKEELLDIVKKQINNFYNLSGEEYTVLKDTMDIALSRVEHNFSNIDNKHYGKNWKMAGGQHLIICTVVSILLFCIIFLTVCIRKQMIPSCVIKYMVL